MVFVAISCSDVRFKKSNKDICLGDERACSVDPSSNELTFDYTETVPYPDTRVDILFIVDNSKSMMDDQSQMAARFNDFMSSINGLDWQIAISTTDTRVGSKEYMGGKLLPFKDSSGQTVTYVLNKNVSGYDSLFRSTIQRKETQDCVWYYQQGRPWECDLNGDERGIYSAVIALNQNQNGFMRSGVPLKVVIISDENERSNGGKYPNLPLVDGQDFAEDLVALANQKGKSLTAYSIIVPSNDQFCAAAQANNSYNDATFPGTIYEKLASLTGGGTFSICASSFTPHLQAISRDIDDGVRDTIKNLACVPKGNTVELYVPATAGSPRIISNVTGRSFSVSPALSPGETYRVRYLCIPF